MNLIEILKEWSGVALAVGAAIYGVFKYFNDFRNGREAVKQNQQHTAQERLATEEKEFDLDSRRVKAAEEVASETLEHLADTREENLNLLDEVYKLKKGMVALNNKVDELIRQLEFANENICFDEECPKRRPPRGTYKGCKKAKEEMSDGAELHS